MGNSIALRIPIAYAKDIGAAEGRCADISFSLQDGESVITPVGCPVYDLSELAAGITDENLHVETSTASAVGAEF